MKAAQSIVIAVFSLLLALPAMQTAWHPFEEEALHGVEAPLESPVPAFHVADFFRGAYQQEVQEWLDRSIGFRGALIRTDNQLNLSLFREISSDYSSPLVLGAQDTLFEKLYIDNFNNQWTLPASQIEALVRSIGKLHTLLRERGIALIILLSPSKTSFYANRIPAAHIRPASEDPEKDNTRRFVSRMEAADVPFIDGRAIARDVFLHTHTPAFPRGGTHWTEYVACHVSQQIMRRAAELMQKPVPPVRCEPSVEFSYPRPLDRDLADLANVWHPERFYETLRYPELPDQIPPIAADDQYYHPKVLFVGGSFLWSILVSLDFEHIYSARDMLYYFQRRFRYPDGGEAPIERANYRWEDDAFTNDLIVIEVNEAAIHQMGSGFIGGAIQALEEARRHPKDEASQTTPHDPRDASTPGREVPLRAPPTVPGSTSGPNIASGANSERFVRSARGDTGTPPGRVNGAPESDSPEQTNR